MLFRSVTYTVSEINVAARYETPKAQNITLINGDADLTVNVNFKNDLKKGSIKINKQSEDSENGDHTFEIKGGGKTYTIKTSSDGVAILKDIPVFDSNNKKITYTIREKNVPVKYVVPADQKVTLTADLTTDVTFKNMLKKFTAEVVKKDSETVSAQGDATLGGAVYGLYKNGELLDTYTTNSDGYFKTKEYVCGNYTIQEISPSEGYLLNETVYSVGVQPENYTLEHNPISMTVTEDSVKGKISIIKHSDDGTTQIETPEEGAEFEVYLKSAGSFEAANEYEKDYLVCDENGYAATKMLPYGTYIVHQSKGWENTKWMPDFEVNICENEKEYFYLINDAVLTSYVKIVKKDAETGNVIPVSGIGFKVWDCMNNAYISQKINYPSEMILDTFYTDESGTLMLPNELVYGDYELHEVQSAEGYVLDKNPTPFTIDGAVETLIIEKFNTAQKGKISVQKTGDIFSSVTVLGSAISVDENGETHESGQTTYTPIFEEKGLSGAVYQVIASEDIVTADGTVRANAGNVVAELTTDENGYAETDLLYLGKYEIKETSAPFGYVKNPEIQVVELTYAGQEVAVRDTINTSFFNEYQGIEIALEKVMESDELFGIGTNSEYKNVRFGLFAAEEITAADGSSIPENGLIAEVSLDENMKAVIAEKVPFGRYYVQEISTDPHYVLNGEKYLVNFEYQGQEMTTVYVDCGQFKNLLKRGTVKGIKVNVADEPLENAVFGLFTEDSETPIITTKSDENGYFEFTDVPYGEYIVHEIAAPEGYILSNESYPVTISEDGEIIKIKAVNQPITVEFSKQDVYGNELIGAEMELVNSSGETVEKWISDGTNHVVTELPIGKYLLKEIATPVGYVIATDIEFELFADGSTTLKNAETTAISGDGHPLIIMVDDTTKVRISKQDITTGEELPGAKLQVIDKDGNVIFEWISTNEPHYIEAKLIAGEKYILREITAPNGYEIAENVEFTVNADGSVTEVVMHDERSKTPETPRFSASPQTGDNRSNLPAYLMLFGSEVIFAALVISRKMKGRNSDEKEN